jgi:hypothetical protein
MANTFELISAYTVGAGGMASINFTSISGSYTDLLIKASLRTDNADGSTGRKSVNLKINGVTTNMTQRFLYGLGGSASSTSGSIIDAWADSNNATTSTFSSYEIYLPNYGSSNYKSASQDSVYENNSSTDYGLQLTAGLWSNTAAITSLGLAVTTSGNFVQYSTAYLYGVKNA